MQSSTRIMDKQAPVGLHLQFDLDHRCGHGLQNRAIEPLTYTHHLDYYFSSARNYAGLENDLDVVVLDLF